MKLRKRSTKVAWAALFICALALAVACGKSKVSEQTFNKRLMSNLKPAMTYEQVVQIVGSVGIKGEENNSASPPTVRYHWKGIKGSALKVTFANNKMIEATAFTPGKRIFRIQADGKMVEITK